MNLYDLKPGDRVRTVDGNLAEVVVPTEDGRWIKVRYVEVPDDPDLVGTEDLCTEDEVAERLSSVAP